MVYYTYKCIYRYDIQSFNCRIIDTCTWDTVFLQRATKLFDLYFAIMLCTGTTVLALPNHVYTQIYSKLLGFVLQIF